MRELKKKKIELEVEKKSFGERVNEWLELSIKTFDFACYARMHFKNAESAKIKKEILATIGSNLILEDKILRLDVPEPLLSVKKAKEKVDEISVRFEPEEKLDLATQMETLYSQNPSLLAKLPVGGTRFSLVF